MCDVSRRFPLNKVMSSSGLADSSRTGLGPSRRPRSRSSLSRDSGKNMTSRSSTPAARRKIPSCDLQLSVSWCRVLGTCRENERRLLHTSTQRNLDWQERMSEDFSIHQCKETWIDSSRTNFNFLWKFQQQKCELDFCSKERNLWRALLRKIWMERSVSPLNSDADYDLFNSF